MALLLVLLDSGADGASAQVIRYVVEGESTLSYSAGNSERIRSDRAENDCVKVVCRYH